MNFKKPVYLIIIFWTLIVFFAILSNEIILGSKDTVYLKTVPVDPKDLFMGDYVILNYEIAQNVRKYKMNENVYVVLDVDENKIASRRYIDRNIPDKHNIFLKGKVAHCSTTVPFFNSGKCVKFGIESYYVKEGEGQKLERNLRQGALVEVAVSGDGKAKVIGFKN